MTSVRARRGCTCITDPCVCPDLLAEWEAWAAKRKRAKPQDVQPPRKGELTIAQLGQGSLVSRRIDQRTAARAAERPGSSARGTQASPVGSLNREAEQDRRQGAGRKSFEPGGPNVL
jgi:hypothetical protein